MKYPTIIITFFRVSNLICSDQELEIEVVTPRWSLLSLRAGGGVPGYGGVFARFSASRPLIAGTPRN